MPTPNPPASQKQQVPDPSDTYERSHPEHEAGQGKMTHNAVATPTPQVDKLPTHIANAQDGAKQINAHENPNLPKQPDHSMLEEEPLGWDQAPSDISDPNSKRHPRTGGKGGTPNVGDADRNS